MTFIHPTWIMKCGAFPAAMIALVSFTGCVGKSMTKPYSEISEELTEEGKTPVSVEQNRELFARAERIQSERLQALVQSRTGGSVVDPNYHLGTQDKIEVSVFDVPELNLTAAINEAGFIGLPLIGGIKAAGLTEEELRLSLIQALSKFVKQPEVTIAISEFGSQKVSVLGAVMKPGTYPLRKGENNLVEILGEAGGATEKAGSFLNFIPVESTGLNANDPVIRAQLSMSLLKGTSQKSGIEIPFQRIMGTNGDIPVEVPIRGGDIIVIPEAGKVTVDGEVEKRGSYELGSNMTLLGALGAAGGITYGAKIDEVEIVRDLGLGENRGHLVIDLQRIASGEDKDILVRPGDVIRVPSDSGKRLTFDTWEGLTRMINFGVGGSVPIR